MRRLRRVRNRSRSGKRLCETHELLGGLDESIGETAIIAFVRIALGIVLLLAAIPLGVTAGVLIVVGTLSDHPLTQEVWEMAAASGAASLVAL